MLQCQLTQWQNSVDTSSVYFRNQILCRSVSGNDVNVLTITNYPSKKTPEGVEQFSKLCLKLPISRENNELIWLSTCEVDFVSN